MPFGAANVAAAAAKEANLRAIGRWIHRTDSENVCGVATSPARARAMAAALWYDLCRSYRELVLFYRVAL